MHTHTHSHFKRTIRYARTSDYVYGAGMSAIPPGLLFYWEQVSPSHVGKGGFAPVMRLAGALGGVAGFLLFYQRSLRESILPPMPKSAICTRSDTANTTVRFYGVTENAREVEMDMREMTDHVKRGEPLYGKTTLTEYMQGVASRNSRYTGVFLHVIPMFNFVNHNQVCLFSGLCEVFGANSMCSMVWTQQSTTKTRSGSWMRRGWQRECLGRSHK